MTHRVDALWLPGWYNLDVSLELDATDEWCFWNSREAMFEHWQTVPNVPVAQLYFFNDLASSGNQHRQVATIRRISHPVIGDLVKVDTSRFGTYTYVSIDGTVYEVEAEQNPGQCTNPLVNITEWYVVAQLDTVADTAEIDGPGTNERAGQIERARRDSNPQPSDQ